MSKRKKIIIISILCLFMLVGIGLILFPIFAEKYNNYHLSVVESEYHEVISTIDNSELLENKLAAQKYNQGLSDGTINGLDPENSGYYNQLNSLDGIMGYIRVPCIDINLPIYHNVNDQTMSLGTGHMPNTSLPIGGENSHCVISAHSGLASRRGFSDLVDMQLDDLFYVDVLDETHCYKVTSIQTVLPYEVNAVDIVDGEDLFSLVTCVPFGVNSHRLVVTGTRQKSLETPIAENSTDPSTEIELSGNQNNPDSGVTSHSTPEHTTKSSWTKQYITAIVLGLLIAVVLIVLFIIIRKIICLFTNNKAKETKKEDPR